jgi:Transcriptional Coactivator p15 (PC4)
LQHLQPPEKTHEETGMDDQILAVLSKGPDEEIRIQRRDYRNHEFIDIRTFWLAEPGLWKATKKGVTIGVELLDEFKAVVAKLSLDVPRRRRRTRAVRSSGG